MIYSSTYSTKMENNDGKKIKNVKSENVKSGKITVKLNKNVVDENNKGEKGTSTNGIISDGINQCCQRLQFEAGLTDNNLYP